MYLPDGKQVKKYVVLFLLICDYPIPLQIPPGYQSQSFYKVSAEFPGSVWCKLSPQT